MQRQIVVSFNSLPNGTYYLHIYDGVSEKPIMQQIVVEHSVKSSKKKINIHFKKVKHA